MRGRPPFVQQHELILTFENPTSLDEKDAKAEIDRYMMDPAQAISYMDVSSKNAEKSPPSPLVNEEKISSKIRPKSP